jgi:hypothetical protein
MGDSVPFDIEQIIKEIKSRDYGLANVFGITEVMKKLDKLTESFEEIKWKLNHRSTYYDEEAKESDLDRSEDLFEPAEPAYDPNWRAEGNGVYWFIDIRDGVVELSREHGLNYDNYRHATNNYYRSQEEAERIGIPKRDKALALARIEKFIYANGLQFEPDWEDGGQKKYFIQYGHVNKTLSINCQATCSSLQAFWFRLEGHAEQVKQACAADLKILFGIK